MAHLSDLIEQALSSGVADPHDAARSIVSQLDDGDREMLVYAGLLDRVRLRVRGARDLSAAASPGPSRWKIAQRVFVDGAWKMLDDCDFEDLLSLTHMSSRYVDSKPHGEQTLLRLRVCVLTGICVAAVTHALA